MKTTSDKVASTGGCGFAVLEEPSVSPGSGLVVASDGTRKRGDEEEKDDEDDGEDEEFDDSFG